MKHSRRDVLKASSIALAGTAGLAATTGTVAASHVGVDAPVLSSVDLNVRDEPSTSGSRIATADQWTGGEVVDGPVQADGYTWWKVSWNQDADNGRITGWSAEGDAWIDGPTDFAYPCWGYITQPHKSGHAAIDVGNETGTPIIASADGTAVVADSYDNSPCGRYVVLDHGGGWQTVYCHLNSVAVSQGQTVARDDKIGELGNTGRSTGPHLHFEITYDGAEQYVPGFDGQDLVGGAGIPKSYR